MNNPSENNKNLYSIAFRRKFLSSLKEKSEESKSLIERKISLVDDSIREIALKHGPFKSSLAEDIKNAKKALENDELFSAAENLTNFNNALVDITDKSKDLLKIGEKVASIEYNLLKYAGLFDFFKKKEEPFEKKHKGSLSHIKEGLKNLLSEAVQVYNNVKVLFDKLDSSRASGDNIFYIKMLVNLKYEQEKFSESFNKANSEFINPLYGMRETFETEYKEPSTKERIQQRYREMGEELLSKDPNKSFIGSVKPAEPGFVPSVPHSAQPGFKSYMHEPVNLNDLIELFAIQNYKLPENFFYKNIKEINKFDYCPCGSGHVWAGCHGKDIDAIMKIMLKNKGVGDFLISAFVDNKFTPGSYYNSLYNNLMTSINNEDEDFKKAEIEHYKNINKIEGDKIRQEALQRAKKEEERLKRMEALEQGAEESSLYKKTRKEMLGSVKEQLKKEKEKRREELAQVAKLEHKKRSKKPMFSQMKDFMLGGKKASASDRIKLARMLAKKY